MRIGVLGTGRIGLMDARNLAQTTGVDEVVLMGRNEVFGSLDSPGRGTGLVPSESPRQLLSRFGPVQPSTSTDRPTEGIQ